MSFSFEGLRNQVSRVRIPLDAPEFLRSYRIK
nr:MAG TPA: hypothetical protein [Caudovirales sp. ct8Ze27]DAU27180.1 MAG TPA: hypothetical protein [Caudoviricetes sp.]